MFDRDVRREIEAVARSYKMEPAALLAVAEVESAGVAFWSVDGRRAPAIRIEGHYFHRRLSGAERDRAVREGLAHPRAGAVRNPRSWAGRYEMLARMTAINRQAALESCSWGLGQVMGANWRDLGFASVEELVARVKSDVGGQADLMARFIDRNGLRDELQRHDWHGFARRYNGPGYRRNRYAEKMAAAYRRYSGQSNQPAGGVLDIQQDLKALGYDPGPLDGRNGPRTTAAVKRFQADNGLAVDGLAGPMTLAEIDARLTEKKARRTDTAAKTGAGLTGGGVTGTTGLEAAGQQLQDAGGALSGLAYYSQIAVVVMIGITLIGVGITLWAVWRRSALADGAPA
jgi:hypothetical protein